MIPGGVCGAVCPIAGTQVIGIDRDRSAVTGGFDLVEQSGPLAEFQVNSTQTPYTYSETIIDDSSVSIVAKFGGRVINKGVRSISADGKTMTIKVVQIGPNSQETPITLVFTRVS